MTENRSFKVNMHQRTILARERQDKLAGQYVLKNMRRWLKQMQEAADCQRTDTMLRIEPGFWDRMRITDMRTFEDKAKVILHGAISHLGFEATLRLDGVHVQWNDFQ